LRQGAKRDQAGAVKKGKKERSDRIAIINKTSLAKISQQGMVVRMRLNRSKTGRRRSHEALSAAHTVKCECGALRLSHHACEECGKYNGRVIIDVVARAKRQAQRDKRKQKELRASGQETEPKQEEPAAKT
jgi:large subunit ribosomal protein L32